MANRFDDDECGDADTYTVQCSALGENGYVVIDENPCKIVKMKIYMECIDAVTQREFSDVYSLTEDMNVPHITKKDYQVVGISDEAGGGFLSLIDDGGEVRYDVRMPNGDLGEDIHTRFDRGDRLSVTVLKVVGQVGQECVISFKVIARELGMIS